MKRPVLLKLDEIRNQSKKHKANEMNTKISPEKKSNKKIVGKSGNSTQVHPSVEHNKFKEVLVRDRCNSAESKIANHRSFSPRKLDPEQRRPRARLPDEKVVRAEKSRATKTQNKRNGSVLNCVTRSTSQRSSVLREVKPAKIERHIREDEAKADRIEEEAHLQDQLLIRKAEETCAHITIPEEDETLALSVDFVSFVYCC